ncbi:hypothetical protein RBH26_12275 [Natronolimnohabitans sp. A-GB9]|uniref:hypothetical protein n=1 Tax=Natronolimnohabitans sp. A-GB9 TaxID=3069757 RepID=UPI0027AFE515|nr:hypothetical protein [Natronolimnohabitans sp. A-GB9]MDQ2051255.1 hypothetical protein [Natronolimnohabitans sp. A-GB9]
MSQTIRINRNDLTAKEIVAELNAGNRVIIELEILGRTLQMALRRRDETYYCDTPMKLLTFETETEMRECLERYRLAKSEADAETDISASAAE